MTQLLKTLGRTALFRGLSEEEAEKALSCLGTQRRCYAKGEAVLRAPATMSAALHWCFRAASVLKTMTPGAIKVCWIVWGRGRCLPRLSLCSR